MITPELEPEIKLFRETHGIFVNLITLAAIAPFYQEIVVYGHDYISWTIAAALFFISGHIADCVSTEHALKARPNAIETSNGLPQRPTKKDLYGFESIKRTSRGLITGIVFPPLGIALGVGGWKVALENELLARGVHV